jgi:hypothetical protein
MSAVFEAAAMSLLSRTLTTALGKYLTNVDVEGLDWSGIRISKVELKATKIMDLPGQKKKKVSTKREDDDDDEEAHNNGGKDFSGHEDSERRPQQPPPSDDDLSMLLGRTMNNDNHHHPPLVIQTTTTTTSTTPTESNDETSFLSPPEPRSGWFSSWYNTNSSSKRNNDHLSMGHNNNSEQQQRLPLLDQSSSRHHHRQHSKTTPNGNHNNATTTGSIFSGSAKLPPPSTEGNKMTTTGYSLHLCEGGRLGVLDVRLVGKALQILVEDADITLQVISAETNHGNDNSNNNNGTASATAAAAAEENAKKTTKSPRSGETTATTSPGERVLAENSLAKLLSTIPNLLLRDIRVTLLLDAENAVEIVIGLLSVTDGSMDVLMMHYDDPDGNNNNNDDDDDDNAENGSSSSDTSTAEGPEPVVSPTENQFLTKRIRTGRGNEAGIVVRLLVPKKKKERLPAPKTDACWARHGWYDAVPDGCLVRLSGLDLQGKIFLGTAAEVAMTNQNQYYYGGGDKDPVVDVDELLFSGVDAIVPGPIPTLSAAPILPTASTEDTSTTAAVTSKYSTDANGIQSCKLSSNFHRVARGLVPTTCHCNQGPTDCECWTNERFPSQDTVRHLLDESLPMPGLALSISIRDPLEINVDRSSLETLGIFVSLFTKPTAEEKRPVDGCDESVDVANSLAAIDDMELMPSESMRSRYSVASHGSVDRRRTLRKHTSSDSVRGNRRSRRSALAKAQEDQVIRNAFPKYMQPEKIQLVGLCIAQIRFRIHVMRSSEFGDAGLSFCYWDCNLQKLAVDLQVLAAVERPFQDLRLSLGMIRVVEYKGVHTVEKLRLGNHGAKTRAGDESTAATTATTQTDSSPMWPSAAAVLCNTQALFDLQTPGTAGLQMRYNAVLRPETHFDFHHKSVVAHFGPVVADASLSIKDDIMFVMAEARNCVLGHRAAAALASRERETRRLESQLFYKATVQCADITFVPLIQTSIPQVSVTGEISSQNGFSLETILADIGLKHGISSRPRALAQGLTLQQLAELPETVRLRILLFVHDLGPLENALGLEPARNSFMQCRAVNKGIVSFAQELQRKATISSTTTDSQTKASDRRQELLNELMQLSDDDLEALLATRRGLYTI